MLTLEQARKLRDGITPGPWNAEYAGWEFGHDIKGPENADGWATLVAEVGGQADAKIFAAAPDLLDLVEAQAAEIAALAAQVEALREELADTNDTLNTWFDTEKITKDQIGPKMLNAAKGYLRTSRSGGMTQDVSDTVEAVIKDMLRLGYLTTPVTQYVMTAALAATEPRHG